jgi:hypothetical protein
MGFPGIAPAGIAPAGIAPFSNRREIQNRNRSVRQWPEGRLATLISLKLRLIGDRLSVAIPVLHFGMNSLRTDVFTLAGPASQQQTGARI